MLTIAEEIANEIRAKGAISFARFMELALYAPELGYYERTSAQIGRKGDFYTSISVGSLFAELIGFDLAQKFRELDEPKFQILESGAHDGQFASDLLSYFQNYQPELFSRLDYILLEPSPTRAAIQRKKLEPFPKRARWSSSWEGTEALNGAILSNELLDAMPVHVFRWDSSAALWKEWGVALSGGTFAWVALTQAMENSGARALLPEIAPELAAVLPEGFTVECSPAALDWWNQAAKSLRRGWLLTCDYGFRADQWVVPERASGTLRSYSRHRYAASVLENPGEQDITAHLNFSALIAAGEARGLATRGLWPQADYLKSIVERVDELPLEFPLWTPARFRQLTSLTHPEQLGRAFKVLLQVR